MPSTRYDQTAYNWELRESAEYKLFKRGTMAVSDLELLGVIVGNHDKAQKLLDKFGSLRKLSQAKVKELMQAGGISRKAALILVSAFELGRRKSFEENQLVRITTTEALAEYIMPKYADHSREVFSVLFLNRNNEVIAEEELFAGGVSAVSVDPKYVFHKAISYLASGLVLIHNHPSGNLMPSFEDKIITQQLVQGGEVLRISVLDHIIVSAKGYYSFLDEGLIKG